MFTTHTKKRRWLAILLVLAMMIGLLPAHATPVQAAEPTEVPLGTIDLRPEGITIDLFDYWSTRTDADPDGAGNMEDDNDPRYTSGINKGHHLKFGQGMGQVTIPENSNESENAAEVADAAQQGEINKWTNGARPMAGIVNRTLDNDGYPTLAYADHNSQSLGYLFDSSSGEGKTAYSNVGGLLRQDENGYYYYNSVTNFAEFHEIKNGEKNVFTVYDQEAVTGDGVSTAGGTGMFFPFNTKKQVFLDDGNYLKSTDVVLNHYFGLHMTTSFQQTTDGVSPSDGETPVTFSFSGDDDVWIFIDDVLVADLGGIHDACAVEIDFHTGGICVYKDSNKNGAFDDDEPRYNEESATLKSMFTSADREDSVAWSGDTFVDESYHTLDFFYLERGNFDSNMRMKYNLKTVPESDLVKVDQDGDPVAGASFELYETDDNYSSGNGNLVAEGKTDASGSLTFRKPNGDILPLSQLKDDGYYLLIEKDLPDGYRHSSEPIKLYVETASQGNKKLLLSYNEWDTGAYAMPKVRVTANTTSVDGDKTVSGYNARKSYNVTDGLIIAAVFKGDNVSYERPNIEDYSIVYGDPLTNWTIGSEKGVAGVIEAAKAMEANSKAQGLYAFSLDSSGAYSADIEHLPGDINDYSWMVNDQNEGTAQFMGAYFFVEDAKSISDIAKTDASKIHLLNSTGFIRDFSMRLYAPNIENRLLVQKVDENGAPITAQAMFTLYKDENGTQTEVGTYPTGSYTLGDETLQGAVAITGLETGEYVLRETKAPAGYEASTNDIAFVVDSSGVHVNAGDSDDDISVKLGVGKIVKSMVQFATNDGIDATLHDITATLQTAENYDPSGMTSWEEGESMNLSYDATKTVLEYGPASADGPVYLTYDSGWGRLDIKQNLNKGADGTPSPEPKKDLDDQSLNNLFSGTTMVVVANQKTATPEGTLDGEKNLQVTKQVTGGEWPEGTTFQFEIMSESPNAPMPAATTITIGKPADGSNRNSAAFGDITFGQPGTYVYHIREVAQTDGDVIYDRHTMTVTVTVEQNFDIRVQTEGSSVFTNRLVDDRPPIDPGDPDDPDTPSLNKDDHYLYIEGYPEDYRTGEYSDNEDLWPVKPQGNITRAEVATIFYRLLKDEVREEIETDVNSFPDVNADDWFNVTVSSLANMNAISGYEDGTFRPNEPITRAELAAMAGRFYEAFDAEYEEGTFLDVEGDEWFADAIAAAKELGILGGYPDGTVRPNNNITRAETCAIVNRVLERRPHDEHLGDVEDMRTWPDNQPGAWYYADMQEATNGHYYEWIDIDGSKFEEWTEVDKDYDWTKR